MNMVEGAANRARTYECLVVPENISLRLIGWNRAPGMFAMENYTLIITTYTGAHRRADIFPLTGDMNNEL
jgi:hypothetical protein